MTDQDWSNTRGDDTDRLQGGLGDALKRLIPDTISKRLMYSIGLIVFLTLLSGVISFISLSLIGTSLSRISDGAVPQMVEAQNLSGATTRVTGLLEELSNAPTLDALSEAGALLEQEKRALEGQQFFQENRQSVDKIKEIISSAEMLQEAASQRLILEGRKQEFLLQLERLHDGLIDLVREKIDILYFDIVIQSEEFSEVSDAQTLISGEVNRLKLIQDLIAEVNAAYGAITNAAYMPNEELLVPIREVYVTTVDRITTAQEELALNEDDADVTAATTEFLALIETFDPIGIRQSEFELAGRVAAIKQTSAQVAIALQANVNDGVTQAEQETYDQADGASTQIGSTQFVSAMIAVAAFGFSVWIMLSYVRGNVISRLTLLTRRMEALAGGDLDIDIPPVRADELGQLTQALSTFKTNAVEQQKMQSERLKIVEEQRAAEEREREEKLRREEEAREERNRLEREQAELRKQQIKSLADELEANLQQILEGVGQSSQAMESTSENMLAIAQRTAGNAAKGANETSSVTQTLQSVATGTEQLSYSVQAVSKGIGQASQSARDANSEAQRVDSIVEGLLESVGRIDNITKLIDDIANKTNLLALNATIEAARAGEMGKGFAVVASEVKSLAGQTAQATGEINSQVAELQTFASDVADAIRQIQQAIETVAHTNDEVESSISEQTSATQEISQSCQNVVAVAQNLSGIIGDVDQSAGETDQAANSLVSNVGNLAHELSRLQEQVSSTIENLRSSQ